MLMFAIKLEFLAHVTPLRGMRISAGNKAQKYPTDLPSLPVTVPIVPCD